MSVVAFEGLMKLKRLTFNDNPIMPPRIPHTGNPSIDRFFKILKPIPVKNTPNHYHIEPRGISFADAVRKLREVHPKDWSELSSTLKYDLMDGTFLTLHHPSVIETSISLRLTSYILNLFKSTLNLHPSTNSLITSLHLQTLPHLSINNNTYYTSTQISLPTTPLPGVVIQVEKLRPFESFTEKADRLLHNGKGDIKLFLGVNLGSHLDLSSKRGSNRWSMSSFKEGWRGNKTNTVIEIQWDCFQMGVDGEFGGRDGFVVRLRDFGKEEVLKENWPEADLGLEVRIRREDVQRIIWEVERELEELKRGVERMLGGMNVEKRWTDI